MGERATEAVRDAYIIDTWTEFLVRTAQPATRIATAQEFGVILGWLRTGIPFRIVLRGIRDTQGVGRTLSYYDGPVRSAYAMWRAAMGGHAA